MSPTFIKHFNKHAGAGSLIAGVMSKPWAQTALGGVVGAGLTGVESASMDLSPVGREALFYTNVGLGLLGGNPAMRNRMMKSWQATDPNNRHVRELLVDPKKVTGAMTGLGAKTLGFALGDKIYSSSSSVSNAGQSIEGAAKEIQEAMKNVAGTTKAIEGSATAIKDFTEQTQKDMGTVTDNLAVSSGGLKDIAANMNDILVDSKTSQRGLKDLARTGIDSIKPISDFFRQENLQRNALGLLAGGAGVAGLWGGYNLLRDYLNYQRIKKEREAKQSGGVPKLAAVPWGKTMTALGTILGGGAAYNNAVNTGLSDSEAILPTAVGLVSGGLAGRGAANANAGKIPWSKAMVPISTTLANDMFAAPAWAMMKGKIQEQKADAGERGIRNFALGAGGGALTIAALAALYQGARAAKKISDGQPLVNAETHNTILSGSGGPENPNVGGKMLVTLPTQNPGDHETTIELPLENVPLSDTLINRIRRDTKRRLRAESSARTLSDDRSPQSISRIMAVN
jgi:hypothetical protein